MYGIQTKRRGTEKERAFENDVKMYGIQTGETQYLVTALFENDVKMYGIQTRSNPCKSIKCLRMM